MKKRMISLALVLAMVLSMTTVAFAAESKDWESDIDIVSVVNVDGNNFATLEDAFANQVEVGAEYVSLNCDLTVTDLVLEPDQVLNLNGYTLTADSVVTAAGSSIVDHSEGDTGVLKIKDADGNWLSEDNSQLPIYDAAVEGYRFFAVSVKSVAVTGKSGTPKYWFKAQVENFEDVYDLINAGAEMDIKLKVDWDGAEVEAEAVADAAFVQKWAEAYKKNDGIYITAVIVGSEEMEGLSVIPAFAANNVAIKGETM